MTCFGLFGYLFKLYSAVGRAQFFCLTFIAGPRITQLMMFIRQKLLKHKYTENVTDFVFFIVCFLYCA